MTLKDILERGYFPKELPPPFNTTDFANNSEQILIDWNIIFSSNTDHKNSDLGLVQNPSDSKTAFKEKKKEFANAFISKYNSSKCAVFSISKGKLSRRFLQIPNPKHFVLLSEKITGNWFAFENIFALSDYSKSYPIPETSENKRSVSTFSKSVSDFRNELLSTSFDKLIEVRVDISKFYSTIYTHSIAWALLGKEKAKYYFKQKDNIANLISSGDLEAELYKFAESVDMAVRSCQERQSIGIPIGPDTSHIIAETVACRIDSIIKSKFESIGLKTCRYYDDFYLYVSTKDDADKVLKGMQLILADFQLEINESKIRVKKFPFAFEDEFTTNLFLFDFKKTNLNNSLKHYFSLIWGFAENNPKKADWIFKYSLRIFEFNSVVIPKNSWKLFEDLLFKTALTEPSILDIVTRILLTYKTYLDFQSKEKLTNMINRIINEHSPVNHNFEVSWALWLSKSFEIEIDENSANKIIETKDSISNLILLDLIKNTSLVQGFPTISKLEIDLKDDILFSENWLLAYESVKKGWLSPANSSLLEDNLFFKLLKDKNICFYDNSKQLVTYKPKTVKIEQTYDNTSAGQTESTEEKILANETEFIHTIPSGLDT